MAYFKLSEELNHIKLSFLILLSLFLLPLSAYCAPEDTQLRAAFIYQFTHYIEWQNPPSPFQIDIIEDQALYEALLDSTKDKKVGISNINIRLVKIDQFSNDYFSKSQMVILPKGSSKEIMKEVQTLKKGTALTISYGEGLAPEGSDINFFMMDSHLRFEINLKAVEFKKIKISSQLLRLGKIYE